MSDCEDVIEIEMDVDIEGSVPSSSEDEEDFVVEVEPTIKFDHEQPSQAEILHEAVTADSDERPKKKYKPKGRQKVTPEQFALDCEQIKRYYMEGVNPGENAWKRGHFKEKAARYRLDQHNILRYKAKGVGPNGKSFLRTSQCKVNGINFRRITFYVYPL